MKRNQTRVPVESSDALFYRGDIAESEVSSGEITRFAGVMCPGTSERNRDESLASALLGGNFDLDLKNAAEYSRGSSAGTCGFNEFLYLQLP